MRNERELKDESDQTHYHGHKGAYEGIVRRRCKQGMASFEEASRQPEQPACTDAAVLVRQAHSSVNQEALRAAQEGGQQQHSRVGEPLRPAPPEEEAEEARRHG